MAIPIELKYTGKDKEFQFRDKFVMPLLSKLGFDTVLNYHGSREFGRDVIFGAIDRFRNMAYFGMQIKFNASVSQRESHDLVDDAVEALGHPFINPSNGKQDFISGFYVANAGTFSDQARTNFFNLLSQRGIRHAVLLDGITLLHLAKSTWMSSAASSGTRFQDFLQEMRSSPVPIFENSDSRIVWKNISYANSLHYLGDKEKEWVEIDDRTGKKTWHLQEISRTATEITLLNKERKQVWVIADKKMTFDGGKWLANGFWET